MSYAVGRSALWGADGRSLHFVRIFGGADSLWVAPLTVSAGAVTPGEPRALHEITRGAYVADRHPTDGRLLIERPSGATAGDPDDPVVPRLVLLTRFDQEIRRVFGER